VTSARLLRAELRRLFARRLVRATLVFVLIAIIGGGLLAFTKTHALPNAEYQQRLNAATVARHQQNERARQCLAAHGIRADRLENIPDSIARVCLPDKEIVVHDPRFDSFKLKGILQGSSGVLAIIGWALGASLVGAEFTSRSMTTMLTWETRRMRVIGSKLAIVVGSVFVLALAALAAVGAAMLPAILFHGAPAHAGDPIFATYTGIALRGSLLAAIAAVMGFAIATIGRNTAAALGVGFAYIIVLENIVGNSLRGWRRWLLLGNTIVFVSGQKSSDIPGRSVVGAGIFLAAVAGALMIGAASSFTARDIA
jgi:ABC-2 type transport system permease protein